MGNTVPPRASREATAIGTGRRGAGTGQHRRPENVVVTEAAPPATPSRRVVTTARKQGRDDDAQAGEEERRPSAGRALRAGGSGADGAAPAPAGKVLTVRMVMTRKDAEALVARLRARSARERKARMAELKGVMRAGTSGGARRSTLPPIIKEKTVESTPVV